MVLHFPEQAFLWDKGKAAAGGHGFAEGFELALLDKIALHVLRFLQGLCQFCRGKCPQSRSADEESKRKNGFFHCASIRFEAV